MSLALSPSHFNPYKKIFSDLKIDSQWCWGACVVGSKLVGFFLLRLQIRCQFYTWLIEWMKNEIIKKHKSVPVPLRNIMRRWMLTGAVSRRLTSGDPHVRAQCSWGGLKWSGEPCILPWITSQLITANLNRWKPKSPNLEVVEYTHFIRGQEITWHCWSAVSLVIYLFTYISSPILIFMQQKH